MTKPSVCVLRRFNKAQNDMLGVAHSLITMQKPLRLVLAILNYFEQ